ncbi:MAG: aldose 1-epimerase [Eudoraea sp.]|nr:aldose 1-epimerase [Eudoraea sp.]
MIKLTNTNQSVTIRNGELTSYIVDGYELMHQKGSPGWGHTDTEMFPIIGPTDKAGYRVHVPKGNALQDQHGLLRELSYETVMTDDTTALFEKTYTAGTIIMNSKYPERSTAARLIWPYSFQFKKKVALTKDGLKITFEVTGELDMPFMIGYHPAFKVRSKNAVIKSDNVSYSIEEVMAAGDKALEVENTTTLFLVDEKELILKSKGFGSYMLWSPVPTMVCIEPISFYPYAVDQSQLSDGFRYLNKEAEVFEIQISVH